VMGVKEIPLDQLLAGKTYLFFSHTIKGQPYNMPLLRRLMDLGCTLVDYEVIVDDGGQRLVFFGRHAGLAGMIDALWALGQRLAQVEDIETPLARLRQAHAYVSLEQAKHAIADVGRELHERGTQALTPLVVGFAGYGNVSAGAQEIFDLLQPTTVEPDDLLRIDVRNHGCCYKVVFREEHLVQPLGPQLFELQHYYDHPEAYRGAFATRYLDQLTVLVNCIYWESRYPRLVTLTDLDQLYDGPPPRLRVIADISCDINGSIEATVKSTDPDRPVYVYDLEHDQVLDGIVGRGPVILAVENLPAELPREASKCFSRSLLPLIPGVAAADLDVALELSHLPPAIQRAVIVHRGQLTPGYAYLNDHLASDETP